MEHEGAIYTNENCIGCNKCVGVCSARGACVSQPVNGRPRIYVDPLRCIACAACFLVCGHQARSYTDDTEAFLQDLQQGQKISVIVSPTLRANYPQEYGRILGTLKKAGVRHILPESFGADICTWAYIAYLERSGNGGWLSSRCPAIVAYIEHFRPELLSNLLPVQSPIYCLATYARQKLGIEDRLAYIGPCVAKSLEIEEMSGQIAYNITFGTMMKYLRARGLEAEEGREELDYGLGLYYPAAGGLAANIRWFLGSGYLVRSVAGKRDAYRWLDANARRIAEGWMPFTIIDIANCKDGCLEGTGTEALGSEAYDDAVAALMRLYRQREQRDQLGPFAYQATEQERLAALKEKFQDLALDDYLWIFKDQSAQCQDWVPSGEEADAIYESMHKYTEASRHIDCGACGYDTCRAMMQAIYNGFTDSRNCLYYEQEEASRLEQISMHDELTGALSHNAYLLATAYGDGQAGADTVFIMADVNGLKRANDRDGHAAGDHLLKTAAQHLAAAFGQECVYRIGGDEFAVLLKGHPIDQTKKLLLETQKALEERSVSIAVGVASNPGARYKELQDVADAQMYKDKLACYARHGWEQR